MALLDGDRFAVVLACGGCPAPIAEPQSERYLNACFVEMDVQHP